ncbi:hypothetical protein TNCV_1859391 [Trichonephila clavipes]|nr:hypothetical protein TNCV_1859391 [Trichonephila clavipes]
MGLRFGNYYCRPRTSTGAGVSFYCGTILVLKITARSRLAGLSATQHGIPYVLEDFREVAYPLGSYRIRAFPSTEGSGVSYTKLFKCT